MREEGEWGRTIFSVNTLKSIDVWSKVVTEGASHAKKTKSNPPPFLLLDTYHVAIVPKVNATLSLRRVRRAQPAYRCRHRLQNTMADDRLGHFCRFHNDVSARNFLRKLREVGGEGLRHVFLLLGGTRQAELDGHNWNVTGLTPDSRRVLHRGGQHWNSLIGGREERGSWWKRMRTEREGGEGG